MLHAGCWLLAVVANGEIHTINYIATNRRKTHTSTQTHESACLAYHTPTTTTTSMWGISEHQLVREPNMGKRVRACVFIFAETNSAHTHTYALVCAISFRAISQNLFATFTPLQTKTSATGLLYDALRRHAVEY